MTGALAEEMRRMLFLGSKVSKYAQYKKLINSLFVEQFTVRHINHKYWMWLAVLTSCYLVD